MYTSEKRDKFVELRAQGWSLSHIATELDITKRTLVEWNRDLATEVQSLRTLEFELLQEKILASREEELNRLYRLQKDIADELGNRRLKYIDTEKLFRLSLDLRQEIERLLNAKASLDSDSAESANGHPRGVFPATNGTSQH
jgi:hypothetical protein